MKHIFFFCVNWPLGVLTGLVVGYFAGLWTDSYRRKKMDRRLNTEDCPRCGCWMIRTFKCNCGQMHGNICDNCGRWTSPTLERSEHTELVRFLGIGPNHCKVGPVIHAHEEHQ
jgi:hypothetical protein